MQTDNIQNNTPNTEVRPVEPRKPAVPVDNTMSMRDIISMCLSNWWWFVISIVVVMSMAVLYLLRTTPVYTRTASILIKEESKGRMASFSDQLSSFSNMGMFSTSASVDNEIVAIQSPAVIAEVIHRLNLDVSYMADGLFHDKVLYGTSLPVNVTFEGLADNDYLTFDLHLNEGGKVVVSKIMFKGDEVPGEYGGSMEKKLKTPVCNITVTPAPQYQPVKLAEGEEPLSLIHVTRSGIISSIQAHSARLLAELNGKKTTIIDLTYNDVSIQRAEDFLNTLISVYNENWVKDKNQIAVSTSAFIDERLRIIESELGSVDDDISSYKSVHQVPNLETAANMYMTQASEASSRAMDLNNQLYMARYIRQFIADRSNNFQLLPANSGISSSSVERQISEYNQKLLQRNALVANSSERNPMVIDYDESLQSMRVAIVASIDNEINSLNTQISALKASEQQSTAKISSNPTQARYLLSVERQQKVKEALYLFLLQKREENELSQAFTAYNTRIVTPPSGSLRPMSPQKQKILLAALMLALALPAGILYLMENMDTKVRGRRDLEQLGIPFLGEIPLFREKGRSKGKKGAEGVCSVVVKERSRDMINEAFRVLRTRMDFMLTANSGKVIMFTSANPGSGKTFLSANMAASLAIRGMRVVALDLDLRRASLSHYVDKQKKGLSEYLSNQVLDWHDILQKDVLHAGVDTLPVGTLPPNPSELLYSNKLAALVTELRELYDIVIIDCPPVDIVADANIVNRLVDMTVFVIRSGLFEKDMLPKLRELYTGKELNSMAVLLNGTEYSGGRNGYHRYGYHHYGYHRYGYGSYGYGYEENDSKKEKKEDKNKQ